MADFRKMGRHSSASQGRVTVLSLQCSRDTHVTPRETGFARRLSAVAKLQRAGDIVIGLLIRGADEYAADCQCGA